MADPKRKAETPEDIHNLFERVRKLELKITSGLKPRGVTNLDQLADVELPYPDELAKPTHGQQLWFDGERDSKFAGLWIAGGGPILEYTFTATGIGSLVIEETLGGVDWDPTTPCIVTATLVVSGDWGPVAQPGSVTTTLTFGATLTVNVDGADVPVIFTDPVDVSIPAADLGLNYPMATAVLQVVAVEGGVELGAHEWELNGANPEASAGWILPAGTPKVLASITNVDTDAYPDEPDLVCVVRVLPLAGRQPAP